MISADIFKNEFLKDQLDKNGCVVVPLADRDMIARLILFYHSLGTSVHKGTHVTMFNPSYEYRVTVDQKIKEICAEKARELMPGYRILYTNFMVKEPGMDGDFPVHQDWTYVDEKQFISYAIWVPFMDVDENNGALHVVKGSHKFATALRGPYVHEPYIQVSDMIREKYSEVVKLKAGEALIWDHRLIHYSRPNITSVPRLAFTLIMVPENTDVFHCFGISKTLGREIDKFKVDTDFFMKYTIGARPENVPFLENIEQELKSYNEVQFQELMIKGK